jgi:hypothetical protein
MVGPMCCFSQPVEVVAETSIFARAAEGARQILVYSMNVKARGDLAMILPLPVPSGAPDVRDAFPPVYDEDTFVQRGDTRRAA